MEYIHICPACGALYRTDSTASSTCQDCNAATVYTGYDYDAWQSLTRTERAGVKRSVLAGQPAGRGPSPAPKKAFNPDPSTFSFASGKNLRYVVLQVTLKEKLFGTGSGNLTELEDVINKQCAKGYRLHTITTTNGGSKGFGGGDRIQATMVFESIS